MSDEEVPTAVQMKTSHFGNQKQILINKLTKLLDNDSDQRCGKDGGTSATFSVADRAPTVF